MSESFSNAIVAALAGQREIFANACGFSAGIFDVGPRGSMSRVPGAWVTGGYYETLGLKAVLGRLLEPADDRPGAPLVAVISYGYWHRRFAGNLKVIGETIVMDNHPVIIVGVTLRGFQGGNIRALADITMMTAALPILEPSFGALLSPGNFWLRVLARPRHGSLLLRVRRTCRRYGRKLRSVSQASNGLTHNVGRWPNRYSNWLPAEPGTHIFASSSGGPS